MTPMDLDLKIQMKDYRTSAHDILGIHLNISFRASTIQCIVQCKPVFQNIHFCLVSES